jgi:hypothetical protein
MAAEELGILGGIGEGHCCGDEWVAGKGLSAGKLPERHTSGAKAHGHFAAFAARLKSCPFKATKGNRRSFDSLPLRLAQGPVAQDDSLIIQDDSAFIGMSF